MVFANIVVSAKFCESFTQDVAIFRAPWNTWGLIGTRQEIKRAGKRGCKKTTIDPRYITMSQYWRISVAIRINDWTKFMPGEFSWP